MHVTRVEPKHSNRFVMMPRRLAPFEWIEGHYNPRRTPKKCLEQALPSKFERLHARSHTIRNCEMSTETA